MSLTIRELERRILLAALGATAIAVPTLACKKDAVPVAGDAGMIGPPRADGKSASVASSKVCADPYSKEDEMCIEPFAEHPRAMGTGGPAPAPAKSLYDADGCLPKGEVSTGCCNPAADGPRKKDGKCCYTVCIGPCCGRPFLVNGEARVAGVSFGATSAWVTDAISFEEDRLSLDLDSVTAQAIGHFWLRDAQMEHASAASFARFLLQLVSVGAPADLVRRAALAAADEVAHAELCFTLAARYLGVTPAPLALALDGALDARSLPAIVGEAIAEGCIGETLAALIAARQHEGARDAAAISALARIAEDEARHAELAWAFVRWAIDVGGEEVRSAARQGFARATAFALPEDSGAADAVAWREHGRLTKDETADVVAEAMRAVVMPCARALLGIESEAGVAAHSISSSPSAS